MIIKPSKFRYLLFRKFSNLSWPFGKSIFKFNP